MNDMTAWCSKCQTHLALRERGLLCPVCAPPEAYTPAPRRYWAPPRNNGPASAA